MQRSREVLVRLALRVVLGHTGQVQAPSMCQLSVCIGNRQSLGSHAQQHLRSLLSFTAPRTGQAQTAGWGGPQQVQQVRQLLSQAQQPIGTSASAAAHCSRKELQRQQQQRLGALQLRRQFGGEAAAAAGGRPAPRSRRLEGKRSLWSGLLLLAPGILAGFLGKWQLERRSWKLDLLQRREIMLKGEPVDIFEVEECPLEYSRVRATGTFDHGKTVYVGPRARTVMGKAEKGYLAIAPLYNAQTHRTVLVNRGWVPSDWTTSEEERRKGQPPGEVLVEGVLRLGEAPGEFVPANVPEKGEWYYINAMQIAQTCGLPPETPLVEVVTVEAPAYVEPTAAELLGGKRPLMPKPADEFPLPKHTQDLMQWSVMPSDHLNYALTWFTLSGFVSLMAVKAIRQGLRGAPK